jgi:hypothetical protein
MPKSRKGEEPKKGRGDDEDRPPRKEEEKERPTKGNPDADPVKIHRDYVERRTGGGGPVSREAYARALEQWHQLPGAVSTSPSEVRSSEEGQPGESEDHELGGAKPDDEKSS